jgi:hypothetical protein
VFGPGLALAFKIAWRNEPAPLSAVVVTVNVTLRQFSEQSTPNSTTSRNLKYRLVPNKNFTGIKIELWTLSTLLITPLCL